MDIFYCPSCDTPLDVKEDEDSECYPTRPYYLELKCPLCCWSSSAVERTFCECWAIVEADMDRKRGLE